MCPGNDSPRLSPAFLPTFEALSALRRKQPSRRRLAQSGIATALLISAAGAATGQESISIEFSDRQARVASRSSAVVVGTVFEDIDGDGRYSPEVDLPVPGAGISDGAAVTMSDPQGRYAPTTVGHPDSVFVTYPPGYLHRNDFFAFVPRPEISTTATQDSGALPRPPRYGVDFPLTRAMQEVPADLSFVQVADLDLRGEQDRALLAQAVNEIGRLTPGAAFVVATGQLANPISGLSGWQVYADEIAGSPIPWFRAARPDGQAKHLLGPAWYSTDFGHLHLLMLGAATDDELARQAAWIELDVKYLAQGRQTIAFLSNAPDPLTLDRLRIAGVKAVFHGGTFSNTSMGLKGGLAVVGQSPLLMGGMDGSPASFRIVTLTGNHMNSEFRVCGVHQSLVIPYPQGELSGPERLMANIYDTVDGVSEARFRLASPEGVFGEGAMTKVGPFTWMGPLDPKEFGQKRLPADFVAAVRVRGNGDSRWENGGRIVVPQRRRDRPAKVQPGAEWPQFMGNAQRTGLCDDHLTPPLRMVWATPTHGHIDFSSPVLYKGTLAIGVKDRDNLINNGVALFSAATGELTHFTKTDTMVNGTPAFVDDTSDGGGRVCAISGAASVYLIDPKKGTIEGRGGWRERDPGWIWASPVAQQRLAVAGGPGGMMGLTAFSGEQRWISTFGKAAWPSLASPALAAENLIMGGNGLQTSGRDSSIYALDTRNGQVRWTNPSPGILGSVAVAAGRGYALEKNGRLKVIDLKTGQDVASVDLEPGQSLSTPAVDPEVIIAATGAGTIHALDRVSLTPLWTFQAGPGLWTMGPMDRTTTTVFSSPVISGATVYIGCSDGNLYALDKQTGQVTWKYNFGVPTLSTPCVSGNSLFTAACDGNVYAFTRQ